MLSSSQLTNAHLNGILHSRLWGEEVKYLTNGQLIVEFEPGSEPVYKDVDFGWIPTPNYAGDPGDAQFLRYALAKQYKFIIEPHESKISVSCLTKDRDPISATNAVEVTEARATAVAIYTMIEVVKYDR